MYEVSEPLGLSSNYHKPIAIKGSDSGQRTDKRRPVIRLEDLKGVQVIFSLDQGASQVETYIISLFASV